MNKIAVGLILTLGVVMGSTVISYADAVVIPVSIRVDAFKSEMKKCGMDLSGQDSSDGEILNMGTSMKVITYKSVTPKQLDLIRDVAFKTART